MRRKKERSKQGQTNKQGKATQHTQSSHFSSFLGWDSNPRHSTIYTLDRAHSRQSALPLSYQGSSAGWAQISHLIVHLMNRLTRTQYEGEGRGNETTKDTKHQTEYMYMYIHVYTCIYMYIHVYMYLGFDPATIVKYCLAFYM